MKNKKLFEKVKKLDLPKGQYSLFGSALMAINGLRKCRDIDIIVTKDIFNKYKNKAGWKLNKTDHGSNYLSKGEIELWREWWPGKWDIKKLIKNSEIIDGLPFVKMKEVIKWKKIYSRDKDLNDIEIVENKLKIS